MTDSPWIEQAEHSLEVAKFLLDNGYYGWSCFLSHQAAEFAIKGIIHIISYIVTGKEAIPRRILYGEKESPHHTKELIKNIPRLKDRKDLERKTIRVG